jgi:Zn-finger nucleic acid-binding protein
VHVDYCTKCHGVFLDKGELDEAVTAVNGTTLRQVITLAAGSAK